MGHQKYKKDRGVLLTGILAVESLGLIRSLFDIHNIINPTYPAYIYSYVPGWYSKVTLLMLVIAIIINISLWAWKKIGVYLLIVSQILLFFNNFFIFKLTPLGVILTLSIVSAIGSLEYWAIYRKWKYFD
jgi:hypothetical protein